MWQSIKDADEWHDSLRGVGAHVLEAFEPNPLKFARNYLKIIGELDTYLGRSDLCPKANGERDYPSIRHVEEF